MSKKKNFLLLALFAFILFSCSKEEVENTGGEPGEPGEPVVIDKSGNRQTLGSWGPQLLTDSDYKSLHIEFGYVEGYKPEEDAIIMLKEFLEKRIYKPGGIEISLNELPSSNKAPFDRDDWESIEEEHRKKYNNDDELAVWVYFADGGKDDGNGNTTNAHGTAYKNTSIVIYAKKMYDDYSEYSLPMSLYQANVLGHEFGHLFGLVNRGITPVVDHKDPDNPTHCITENCLMASGKRYTVNDTEMFVMDDACLQDLRSIGGK